VLLEGRGLAVEKGLETEFGLHRIVAHGPGVLKKDRTPTRWWRPTWFYSGRHQMLNIPTEMYTPIFCVARTAGWAAHRIEELVSGVRIIRPAYRDVLKNRPYLPMSERR
jgi:citrate synthase